MNKFLVRLLVAMFLAAPASGLWAQAPVVPGDVLVMLRESAAPGAVVRDLSTVNGRHTGLRVVREVSAPMRAWLFHFNPGVIDQAAMLRAFQAHPMVQLAQCNHVVKGRNVPNDPLFGQQWFHQNIQSEPAWNITTGGVTAVGDTIVVAIIEKADLGHPDLAANAWINHGEIPGNGIDDDGNGYVDDVRGWDPVSGTDNVYGDNHGTEVAGMIGAVGNNGLQVAGANWHVKMMPVNYANSDEANVITAYTYPLVMRRLYNASGGTKGAFVAATNASWGVDGGQPANAPLWCALYDTLGAAGVLNCAATTNNNVNVDVTGDLPTACPGNFLVSVTATNSSDQRTFSGYGATTIDVGAPGASVLTPAIGGGTATASGTSFASPLTAGVVALMYSVPCASFAALAHNDPQEAALRVRQALFDGVDHVGNLPGNTVTGGRINAFRSVQLLMDSCSSCPAPYNLAASSAAIGSATLAWSALPGTFTVRYRLQGQPDWTVVPGLTGTSCTISALATCQPYEFQVAATCDTSESPYSPVLHWTSEGCCTAPASIAATALDTSTVAVSWATVLASTTYDLRFREINAPVWTELDGLNGNGTTLTGLSPCSDLEIQMRSLCGGNSADWSPSVMVHIPGCGQCMEGSFCASQGQNANSEWIARVKLGGIDRSSGNDQGYANVLTTGQSTDLVIGGKYPLLLVPGYSGAAFPEYFTIWMDLDHNGQFTGNERVFDPGHTVSAALSDSLTVPATATPGSTRMRVVMEYNTAAVTGCTTYDYGETEDYCVTLVNGTIGLAEHRPSPPVRLYPQPADQFFTILTGREDGLVLSITDMTGRTVLDQRITGGHATVATAGLGAGMYLYRLQASSLEVARGSLLVVH